MRLRVVFALAVIALVSVACSGQKQEREFGRVDVQNLNKFAQDFAAAYTAHDVDKVVGFFSGSAVLMPPNASTMRGTDSLRGFYENRFAEGAGDLVIELTDVTGAGTLAYAAGTFRLNVTPTEGSGAAPQRERGKILWIFRNLMGRWVIEYSMWSSDLPPPAPPPADEAAKTEADKK